MHASLNCSGIKSVYLHWAHLALLTWAPLRVKELNQLNHSWVIRGILVYFMFCIFRNTRVYSLLILLHLGKPYTSRSFSWTIFKAALSESNHQTSKFLKLRHLQTLRGWGLSNPRPSLPAPGMRGWHSFLLVQTAEAQPGGLDSPLPSREMGQINNNWRWNGFSRFQLRLRRLLYSNPNHSGSFTATRVHSEVTSHWQ